MAANADQILECHKLMRSMKYDGTSDITLFLRGFDGLRTRILGLDPDYDDFIMEATLSTCLEDANPSPSVGVDGERYIGPASWWAKQPIDDVDTYDKLKRKLESKFKAKVENMSKIFSRLAQLERGDKTVKDFAYEFDCVRGTASAEVHDYTLIDIFTKQMPQTVVKCLLISCPDFREKTYEEVKNLCVKLDPAVRNPDPLENGYAKKFSKLRIGEDRQDHVARLERQLAERQEQLNYLLKGAERWTLRAAPVRILTRQTDPREFQKHFGSNFPGEAENLEPGRLTEEGDRRRGRIGERTPRVLESDCRDTKRSDKERESLRQQLGVPATKLWEDQLQKHSSTLRAAPKRILTRKADPEEEEEFGFSTVRGGFSFTAGEPEGVCATKSVLDFAKMAKELEAAGVAPAGARPRARRGDPDSLFPDPVRGQKPLTELMEWFESLRPPISMEDLLKTSPTYRREFQKYLGETENSKPGRLTEEGDRRRGKITEEGAGNRSRRRIDPTGIPEPDSESDSEERPVEPRHRLRNRDIYTSSREEPVTHHILTSEWKETETVADAFEPVAEPAKETEAFAQSAGARESSNDGQHVQLPARLVASKVFIIKRFNRRHLDVKPFLPTLGHTQLQNFRYEDIQSRLASGSDPPHHTTAAEELRGVDIEGLDTTVKTIQVAGSRDDCSLHTVTGVSIGRSPVLVCEKVTEVTGKYVLSEYKITRLGPGPEPPPESLGFGEVKLTFLMVYIRRTFTFVFRTQGAHSHGQQHSLISYYVDKPDPDPEPPPGCLHSLPDGEDQAVVAGGIVVELR
jgi:hypothetical protein